MKIISILCFCAIINPGLLIGQERKLLPAGDLIPRVLGDQREPRLSGKLIAATEGATLFGSGIEGEAGIGRTFPIYLFSGSADGDYVALALGAGVWGRFNMETAQKHFISSDWNFRVPVIIKRGANSFALSYNHISSHLGDEYIDRFDAFTISYSIDNLRAIWFRSVGEQAEVYGGGTFAMNITPQGFERWGAQFGAQLRAIRLTSVADGFASIDVTLDQNADWDPRISIRSGVTLFPESPNRFSFVLEGLTGPSPQGEFLLNHETFVSLGVSVGY